MIIRKQRNWMCKDALGYWLYFGNKPTYAGLINRFQQEDVNRVHMGEHTPKGWVAMQDGDCIATITELTITMRGAKARKRYGNG